MVEVVHGCRVARLGLSVGQIIVHKGTAVYFGQLLCLLFQGKWKLQIIYELCIQSPLRFGELKKVLKPITNTMLTNALKELEVDGQCTVSSITRSRHGWSIP